MPGPNGQLELIPGYRDPVQVGSHGEGGHASPPNPRTTREKAETIAKLAENKGVTGAATPDVVDLRVDITG